MVDYDRNTGTAGKLRIRDLGYQIQFWLYCTDGATRAAQLPWSGRVNGQDVGGTVNWTAGLGEKMVAAYDVGSNQQVRFSIGSTGTQGFGGPTDLVQDIARGTKPDAPTNVGFIEIGATHMVYQFTGNGDGGNPIQRWEYQFWASPDDNAPWALAPSDGIVRVGSLPPGTVFWARARGVNVRGAGDPSPWISGRTRSGPRIKVGSEWKNSIAYVKVGNEWRIALCYVKVGNEWRLAGA